MGTATPNLETGKFERPTSSEYAPYFQRYIDLVRPGDFLELLKKNTSDVEKFFRSIAAEKYDYRYAADKWTVKEVLMHIIDMERVFAYRALVCSRGDKTKLPPADENLYAANAEVGQRTIDSLIDEFMAVRRSSEILFENMTEEQSRFEGQGATHTFTARAIGYIIIGHSQHHLSVVKERYL